MSVKIHAVSNRTPYTVTISDDKHHQWLGDEPVENGGVDAGPTPSQLLLSGLATCTIITLKMYAAHKQWTLTQVEVEIELNDQSKPEDDQHITRHITLDGELSDEQRERLLQVANACPIHKLLTGTIVIDSLLLPPTSQPSV